MYYVAANRVIYDDGYGMQTAPAYGVDAFSHRYELSPHEADELTKRFQAEHSRVPLGNAVARMTKAVGIQSLFRDSQGSPCAPCQRRQAAMNEFGDRIADWFSARGSKL